MTQPFSELLQHLNLNQVTDAKLAYKTYYYTNRENLKSQASILKENNNLFTIAQRGNNVVLSFDKDTQIVIENSHYVDVIPLLYDNFFDFLYTIKCSTAEYHTYMSISDNLGNVLSTVGVAPKQKGAKHGEILIRDDSYYLQKYYVGDKFVPANKQNPHFNKGSVSVTVPITEKQYDSLESFLKNNKYTDIPYNLFSLFGGINCVDYANDALSSIGIERKIIDFYKIDELDHRDQGILYMVWDDIGTFNYIYNMPYDAIDQVSFRATGMGFSHAAENLLSRIGYYDWVGEHPHSPLIPAAYNNDLDKIYSNLDKLDVPNHSGDTPLHISLEYNKLSFAAALLAKNPNVNLENDRGYTPLHFAASLPPSEEKNYVLLKLIKMGANVNDADSINYMTPLARAVLADDYNSSMILLEYGANASFVNSNNDNLANIALMHRKLATMDLLSKYNKQILFHDNLEHQIPICEVANIANPEQVVSGFKELWEGFNQSLCKDILYKPFEII